MLSSGENTTNVLRAVKSTDSYKYYESVRHLTSTLRQFSASCLHLFVLASSILNTLTKGILQSLKLLVAVLPDFLLLVFCCWYGKVASIT
jgi:hypothetical protein